MFNSFFAKKGIPVNLTKGTQIALVPDHAYGDINHPDVKLGFVATYNSRTNAVYCRFWSDVNPNDLRTKANSEYCEFRNIQLHDSKPQSLVDEMIEKYGI